MHAMWAHWAPPLERSTLIGFTFAGKIYALKNIGIVSQALACENVAKTATDNRQIYPTFYVTRFTTCVYDVLSQVLRSVTS